MNYNYAQVLEFDRASSVTLTKNEATRKLAAWEDRLTISDYPDEWQVDLMNGEFVTLSSPVAGSNNIIWSGTDSDLGTHTVEVVFSAGLVITEFNYSGPMGDSSMSAVTEGEVTLEDETRIKICDPSLREGNSELKIKYTDMSRAIASSELDDYCHAYLGCIADTEIKGHTITGTWRLAEILKQDSDNPDMIAVVLVYKQGYLQTLNFAEAIIMNKEDFRDNGSTLLIKFPNIDPRYTETAKAEFSATETLTNPVFGGVRYDGYWTNNKMDTSEVSSRYADLEDAANVIWYLSRHNNSDAIYNYYGTYSQKIIDFFKYQMVPEGKIDFEENYYFAPDGIYYSEDGIVYTKFNGVDVVDPSPSPYPDLPDDAKLLSVSVAGRLVEMDERRREDDRTTDLSVRVTFTDSKESGTIYRGGYHGVVTEVNFVAATPEAETEFSEALAFDSDGNWYHKVDPDDEYDRKNGIDKPISSLPPNYTTLDSQSTNQSIRVRSYYDIREKYWNITYTIQQADQDIRLVRNDDIGSGVRLSYKPNSTTTLTIERGAGMSEADMRTVNGYYSACSIGTTRRIDVKETGAGTYDYDAIEIANTGVETDFQIGPDHFYLGYNYDKEPTTSVSDFEASAGYVAGNKESDSLILIGAEWVASAWVQSITSTSTVAPSISHNDDGTWNWNIKVTSVDDVDYGEGDPDVDTGAFLFEYGEPGNIIRWTGRYLMKDIVGGNISLIGDYPDILTGTGYGTHATLTGRRLISRAIRNERIIDGKISYDVYENEITSDINTDDAWFLMGVTESLDRVKQNIVSEFISSDGEQFNSDLSFKYSKFYQLLLKTGSTSYPPDTDISNYDTLPDGAVDGVLEPDEYDGMSEQKDVALTVPIYARLQMASKRRKTVTRERKYFIRRPTTEDLEATDDDGGANSIADQMALVSDETTSGTAPTALGVKTYDVLKLGEKNFAIERMTVKIDVEVYRDEDAFDRLVGAEGDYMTGSNLMPLHKDPNLNPVFQDTTKSIEP